MKWHQDFLFTPHSNDDIITALLMVSDVTPENGPLNVVPGSHRPLWSHWQDGRFTGSVDDEVVSEQCQQPEACFGPSGSVCFMHTRLLHASSPNETEQPRTLFISVYAAEDALPFGENPCQACTRASWWPAWRAAGTQRRQPATFAAEAARRLILRSASRPRSCQHVMSSPEVL